MVLVKPKRPLPPAPILQSIISEITQAEDEHSLTSALHKFDSPHQFERPEERNLINWYKVLNRFDELLARYISDHNILPTSSSSNSKTTHSAPSDGKAAAESSGAALEASSNEKLSDPLSKTPERSPAAAAELLAPTVGPPIVSGSEVLSTGRVFHPSRNLVVLILRVTQRIIRDSSHDSRHVYNSFEHLTALLADQSRAVVVLAMEILSQLMQRSHKFRATRISMSMECSNRLSDLAVGWGGRENGLGLLECCVAADSNELPAGGRRLLFEYIKSSAGEGDSAQNENDRGSPREGNSKKSNSDPSSRSSQDAPLSLGDTVATSSAPPRVQPTVHVDNDTTTIVIEDVNMFDGDEQWLLKDFAQKHNVPHRKLFSLLCAFRRAKMFGQGRGERLEFSLIRLYALIILYQTSSVFSVQDHAGKESELIQDLVELTNSDSSNNSNIPSSLCVIALRCLTAMTQDRRRVSAIMNATGVSQHHGALPTLLRTVLNSVLSSSTAVGTSSIRTDMDSMTEESETTAVPPFVSVGSSGVEEASFPALMECSRMAHTEHAVRMSEWLLALVHSLALGGGSSGATPLANSGILRMLVPLLSDRNPTHFRAVGQGIKCMQVIIENSGHSAGCQVFREQDGLSLAAERIASEMEMGDDMDDADVNVDEAVEVEALRRRGESRALYERLALRQMTPVEALDNQPPSTSAAARGLLSHSRWALLRALHQLLTSSLGSGGSEVRELVVNSQLPKALRRILAQPFLHGGSLFQAAATVTTDIAHAEPTATAELVKAGIATTVLKTITQGLPPCGEAVRCIPSLLAALCLSPSAREVIVNSSPLEPYLLRLATPFYTRALHGETPTQIGNSLDELMRHVEALRKNGNRAMCEYLRMSSLFVKQDVSKTARFANRPGNSARSETSPKPSKRSKALDSNVYGSDVSGNSSSEAESAHPDLVLLDKMKLAVANNSCRLVGIQSGSSEHQEGIVSNGGLVHIIKLRLAPALATPETAVRDGQSYSRHYPTPGMTTAALVTSLRNFSAKHATTVIKVLFEVILEDAASCLKLANLLDDKWLPEEDHLVSSPRLSSSARNASGIETKMIGASTKESVPAEQRKASRAQLSESIRELRVDVALFTGLLRGSPGSCASAWEAAGGSQVTTVISTVERAARCHLARVYTGLTLTATVDGDLTTAQVSAAADPAMKALRPELLNRYLGDLGKLVDSSISKSKRFDDACKTLKVPPEGQDGVRQDVKGLAWHLVTFAVAVQRLYQILSKGLAFTSRRTREVARFSGTAKLMAASIGRIFVLHLKAAKPLWNEKVCSAGSDRVVAAWDYVRGILIEIKGSFFEETREATHPHIIRAFFEAGGADALLEATQPLQLVSAASPLSDVSRGVSKTSELDRFRWEADLDLMRKTDSLTTCAYILALSKALPSSSVGSVVVASGQHRTKRSESPEDDLSSDTVTHQARAISRIVVADSEPRQEDSVPIGDARFRTLLSNPKYVEALTEKFETLKGAALARCKDIGVNRVASDAWSTLCGFLYWLASCPGLLNANNPAITDPPRHEDWSPQDIQRGSQATVLELLRPVIGRSDDLLAIQNTDGSALADILGIVNATTVNYRELSLKQLGLDGNMRSGEDWEDFLEPQEETPSSRPLSPDPEMVQSLVEMGFSRDRAAGALRRTAPGGIEFAMEWLLANQEEEEQNQGRDEEGESQGEQNEEDESGPVDLDGEDDADEDVEIDDEANEDDDDDNDDEDEEEDDDDDDDDGEDVENAGAEDPGVNSGASSERRDNLMAVGVVSTPREEVMADSPHELVNGRPLNDNLLNLADSVLGIPPRSALSIEKQGSAGKSPVLPAKSPAVCSFENQGLLLERSVLHEMKLLGIALRAARLSGQEDVPEICKRAAQQVGWTCDDPSDQKDLSNRGDSVAPVTVATYKTRKKELFDSLLEFVRFIIAKTYIYPKHTHLPFVAIELLSSLHRDGTVSEQDSEKFAGLLSEGLTQFLQTSIESPSSFPELKGQAVSLWAHYGGLNARTALSRLAVFELAFDRLQQIVITFTDSRRPASVGEEAIEPIEKLRITEGEASSGSGKPVVGTSGAQHTSTRTKSRKSRSLRAPTKPEVIRLGQLNTCMLILDARIRYGWKDDLLSRSQKLFGQKADGDNKMMADKKSGKMDTEPTARHQVRQPPINDEGQQDSAPPQCSTPNGSSASKGVEVEMGLAEEDETVMLKAEAEKKRIGLVDATRTSIAELMGPEAGSKPSDSLDYKALAVICVRLLRSFRDLEAGDAMLSLLQLLTSLTRDWNVAKVAVEEGVIEVMLSLPHIEARQTRSVDYRIVRSLVKTVLRHAVEDLDTLVEAMTVDIRSIVSNQSRGRPTVTVRSLLTSTAPMAARDMGSFITAVSRAVTTFGSDNTGYIELRSFEPPTESDLDKKLAERPNVTRVVSGLSKLLVVESQSHRSDKKVSDVSNAKLEDSYDLAKFALDTLADITEISPVTARAFLTSESPSSSVNGSALDFILQKLLPLSNLPASDRGSSRSSNPLEPDELASGARKMFLVLCKKGPGVHGVHEAAVSALARAVALEAEKEKASPGLIRGIAMCIVPGSKSKVVRCMLETNLPNDLARCLGKLNVATEVRSDITATVLQALALLGQAAGHLARRGMMTGEEIITLNSLNTSSRDPWSALRDREDLGGHSAGTGFMVI